MASENISISKCQRLMTRKDHSRSSREKKVRESNNFVNKVLLKKYKIKKKFPQKRSIRLRFQNIFTFGRQSLLVYNSEGNFSTALIFRRQKRIAEKRKRACCSVYFFMTGLNQQERARYFLVSPGKWQVLLLDIT